MTKPVKYGFVVGLVTVIWVLSIYFTHNQLTKLGLYSRLISFLFLIPAVFMAVKDKRDNELGGFITLKTTMRTGMTVAAIYSLVVMLFTFIYFKFIDHEILSFYLEETERYMKSEGKATPEDIQKALGFVHEFYSPFKQATAALFSTIIAGALLTFICSTFLVKNPPEDLS